MRSLALAIKLLRREWRAGELKILIAALLIAVTCMTSVNLFSNRIQQAMTNQASDLLGGDMALTSPTPPAELWLQQAKKFGIKTTQVLVFYSMLSFDNQLQLATIHAVDKNYPLRGELKITDQPAVPADSRDGGLSGGRSAILPPDSKQNFVLRSDYYQEGVRGVFLPGTPGTAHDIPAPNTIWLEAGLLPLLNAKLGDNITLGSGTFKLTHILIYQPEVPGSSFSFSPHAVINLSDVVKTAVVQPGSRLQYTILLAGDSQKLTKFSAWLKPQLAPGQKLFGAGESRPSLQTSLERVQHYLGLGSLISVILAGVALAVALKRFATRHYDTVALMRCYGASSQQVLQIYLWLLLMVGFISILTACAMGLFAQMVLEKILSSLINIQLPPAAWSGIWFGVIAGLWVLLAFGLPPLWQLTRVSPLKVLRRDMVPLPLSNIWIYLTGLLAVCGLILWHTHDIKLAVIILTGCIVAAALFLSVGWLLIVLMQKMRRTVGVAWRYGLANLARHWQSSILQIAAFGFTLMVLLLLLIVRNDLIATWQNELPPAAPNYFIINISKDQVVSVKEVLKQHAQVENEQFFPMIRGRLFQLNQQDILSALPLEKRTDESLNRELNLSWSETLPHNNKILQGRWWQEGDKNVISVEQGLAERLGLKIGDELGFRIGASIIAGKIISIRQLDWSSLQPNFYVLFPPGILDDFPSTYITSIYLPAAQSSIKLNTFIQQFPNLTVINIAEVLKQVQNILFQAGNAIQYLFFFALLAGLVVLYASVYASLDTRLFEGAILRALGASRYQLLTGLIAEFVILGALSGLLAAIVANGIAMVLGKQLFDLILHFNFVLLFIAIIFGAIIIGAIGVFATRKILSQSPLLTLQEK